MAAWDEGAILQRLQEAGRADREAIFGEIFAGMHERIFALCRHLTGSRAEAEDAVQECFWAVYQALSGFRGESRLSTWVYRIALHAALRIRARRGAHPEPLERAHEERSNLPGPEETAAARQEQRKLQVALEQLGAEHRTVLSLFAVDGLSHQEIADVLGVPVGTVWSRLHGARRRLRELMG